MKQIILFSSLVLILSSCTKVIDLKLKNGDPQIVIEANYSNDTVGNQIVISKSVLFGDKNEFPMVNNATVTLADENGNQQPIAQTTPGVYKILNPGIPGKTYTMNVTIDGKSFSSTGIMPLPTKLDSVDLLKFAFGPNETISIVPIFKDSLGIKNFYRFEVFKNDTVTKDLFINDDVLIDGIKTQQPYFGVTEYESGDKIQVNMQCINAAAYLYFFSLEQNSSGQAAPANPVSNITGGALGYFNPHSVSKKTIIVP